MQIELRKKKQKKNNSFQGKDLSNSKWILGN